MVYHIFDLVFDVHGVPSSQIIPIGDFRHVFKLMDISSA